MNPNQIRASGAFFSILLGIGFAIADENHYNNMVIGDRAMGMGGAYTAISDDPSGLYYNPAGIVYAGRRNLSASVNALNYSNITYKEVLGGQDWVRDSSTFRPNFFGVIQPLGKGTAGFSYAVTDAILEDQDGQFENLTSTIDRFVINFNNEDTTVEIGPGYALELSDNFAAGLTLYFHQRSRETINNSFIRLSTGEFEWLNDYFQTDETGITPIFGVMWAPMDKLSLGLSVRRTFVVSSDNQQQSTCASDITNNGNVLCRPDATTANAQDPLISGSDSRRELPTTVIFGAAFFPSPNLAMSADLSYFSAVSDFQADRSAIVNMAAGIEYYFSDQWALRSGFYTNFANTPHIDVGDVNSLAHIDYYGLTASVTRFTRNSSITAGMSFVYGTGEAQLINGSTSIQDVDARGGSLFISTSYTY